jgi:hypothetical protein
LTERTEERPAERKPPIVAAQNRDQRIAPGGAVFASFVENLEAKLVVPEFLAQLLPGNQLASLREILGDGPPVGSSPPFSL